MAPILLIICSIYYGDLLNKLIKCFNSRWLRHILALICRIASNSLPIFLKQKVLKICFDLFILSFLFLIKFNTFDINLFCFISKDFIISNNCLKTCSYLLETLYHIKNIEFLTCHIITFNPKFLILIGILSQIRECIKERKLNSFDIFAFSFKIKSSDKLRKKQPFVSKSAGNS